MQGNDLPRSSLRPNVVLPSFRALWCTPCLEKMPDLNKLHERHSEEDIIVVGYSIDRESKVLKPNISWRTWGSPVLGCTATLRR